VCRLKHVEPLKNFGIINSITKLHLVGISAECVQMFEHILKQLNNPFFTLKVIFMSYKADAGKC
jgi:hypothetical protein